MSIIHPLVSQQAVVSFAWPHGGWRRITRRAPWAGAGTAASATSASASPARSSRAWAPPAPTRGSTGQVPPAAPVCPANSLQDSPARLGQKFGYCNRKKRHILQHFLKSWPTFWTYTVYVTSPFGGPRLVRSLPFFRWDLRSYMADFSTPRQHCSKLLPFQQQRRESDSQQ
jgi:hypothetical protein